MTTQDTNHDTAAGEVLQEQVDNTHHSLLGLAVYVGLRGASLGHSNIIKALTPPTTHSAPPFLSLHSTIGTVTVRPVPLSVGVGRGSGGGGSEQGKEDIDQIGH